MSVGSALAEARARAGLSLDQVAEQTRIRRTLIESIEADDFHACGGDFYSRGHIRSIAHAVGIDPEPLVAEFDGAHPHDDPVPTAAGVLVAEKADDPTRRTPNWTAAMAAALLLVVGLGGWAALRDDSSSGGAATVAADRPTSGATDGGAGDAATTSPVGPTAAAQPTDRAVGDAVAQVPDGEVVVTLSTDDGRSWVSATGRNGRVLYEGILEPNRTRTVRDSSKVFVVLGNAGAVSLTVNGEDLGTPGSSGEVQRLTFGPGPADRSGG